MKRPTVSAVLTTLSIVPLGLGLLAGAIWADLLVEPWYWTAHSGHLSMGEQQAAGQFGAVAWFVAVGAFVGAAFGAVLMVRWRAWPATVPIVIVGSALAGAFAWQFGVHLFGPPDPESLSRLKDGQRVAAQLSVDSVVPFLIWPTMAAFACFAASVFVRGREEQPDAAPID